MVQMVFVHGVSVRNDPATSEYEDGLEARRQAFRDWGFGGANAVEFQEPYWGKFGAPATYKSLDSSGDVALAIGDSGLGDPLGGAFIGEDSTDLLDAARENFVALANSLAILLVQSGEIEGRALAENLADYVVEHESDSVEIEPQVPDWVKDSAITTDEQFLDALEQRLGTGAAVSLGLGDPFKKVGAWLARTGLRRIDGKLAEKVRTLTPQVTLFLGDAFIYLKASSASDDRQAKIRTEVGDAIVAAATAAAASGEKLIVCGHSMGANILYDMLTSPATVQRLEQQIGGSLAVDLLLTVGTQMGLLEELKLFEGSKAGQTATRPTSCARWWHVHNRMDVLSFNARGVFDGVVQFQCDTNADIIDAHGAYFTSPVFQKRLYRRMKTDGLVQ